MQSVDLAELAVDAKVHSGSLLLLCRGDAEAGIVWRATFERESLT
jgi:hypothetical protein